MSLVVYPQASLVFPMHLFQNRSAAFSPCGALNQTLRNALGVLPSKLTPYPNAQIRSRNHLHSAQQLLHLYSVSHVNTLSTNRRHSGDRFLKEVVRYQLLAVSPFLSRPVIPFDDSGSQPFTNQPQNTLVPQRFA